MREKPAGTVRITSGDHQAKAILMPALAKQLPTYCDLHVAISVNLGFVDIVAERFDVGVRLGETVAKDMVAVRIGPDMHMAVVGSPAHFETRTRPRTPHDLAAHNCIGLRFPTGGIYLWEFEKNGHPLNVRIEGQLTVNNVPLARQGALDGLGLAFLPEEYVRPEIAYGDLLHVLADWCDPFPDYHLNFPSRRQQSSVFAVVVDAMRWKPPAHS